MEFYRVEYLIENFKESNEKESEQHKRETAETREQYNPSKLQSQQSSMMRNYMGSNNALKGLSNIPKMPKMPKF